MAHGCVKLLHDILDEPLRAGSVTLRALRPRKDVSKRSRKDVSKRGRTWKPPVPNSMSPLASSIGPLILYMIENQWPGRQ